MAAWGIGTPSRLALTLACLVRKKTVNAVSAANNHSAKNANKDACSRNDNLPAARRGAKVWRTRKRKVAALIAALIDVEVIPE